MIKASLKSMLGRKLRTALTAFAVLLGVAMVAGAYVITDTMLSAADDLETASYSTSDAVVSSERAFDIDTQAGFSETKPVPEALLAKVRAVPEVGVAVGEVTDSAKLIDQNDEVIGSDGAPAFAVGFDAGERNAEELSPFEVRDGRFPRGPGEIAIDASTAENEDLGVGDRVGAAARGPTQQFRIVGIATFGDVESIGNATAAIFELAQAQELFRKQGQLDSILVKGRQGTPSAELISSLEQVVGPGAQVETASEQDRFDLGGLKEFLNIIQKVLVGFGAVSVFVGAFIIFNTLSITVAQRAREFGLLRMIGASRRQILGSVIVEALVIGLIASALGILAGIGLAKLLDTIFTAIGLDLPQSGTVFKARTAVLAFVVGVGVTLVAGLAPALRATRVAPVAALRDATLSDTGRRSRFALPVAIVTTVLGVALLAYGMFASEIGVSARLAAIGVGCLILFVGVALFSPRLVRPLASFLGRPAERVAGAAGKLARGNSMRNPSRTATTAAALMIGLALVTFVAVLGQGLRDSFGNALDEQVDADYIVTAQDGFSPFAPEVVDALRRDSRVESTTFIREDQIQAFDDVMTINGVDPATIDTAYRFDIKEGPADVPKRLGTDGAIVTERFSEDHGLAVGERFQALAPSGRRLDLAVRAIDDRPPFNPLGLANVTVSTELFDRTFQTRRNRFVFVQVQGGAKPVTEEALQAAVEPFSDAKLQTQPAYREDSEKDLQDFLALLYVLLALSVIVSLFGIVNTLVLSVFERTREIGMLRAVGMTRRQVRRMIRHESIIVALIGAVLGMVVGVFLAALVTQALSNEGVTFSVPIGSLIAFLVVAVIAGMLAAILPARRASRLNVLEALQYE